MGHRLMDETKDTLPARAEGEEDDAYRARFATWLSERFQAAAADMLAAGNPVTADTMKEMILRQMEALMREPDVIEVQCDPDDPTKLIVTRLMPEQFVEITNLIRTLR